MYCRYCGYDLGDKESAPTYCPNCGAKVVRDESSNNNSTISNGRSNTYNSTSSDSSYDYSEKSKKIHAFGRLFTVLSIVTFLIQNIVFFIALISGNLFDVRRFVSLSFIYLVSFTFCILMLVFGIIYRRNKYKNGIGMIVFGIIMSLISLNSFRALVSVPKNHFAENNYYYSNFFSDPSDENKVFNFYIDEISVISSQDSVLYTYIEFSSSDKNNAFYSEYVEGGMFFDSPLKISGYNYMARGDMSTKKFVTDDNASSDVLFLYNYNKGYLVMIYVDMDGEEFSIFDDPYYINFPVIKEYPEI